MRLFFSASHGRQFWVTIGLILYKVEGGWELAIILPFLVPICFSVGVTSVPKTNDPSALATGTMGFDVVTRQFYGGFFSLTFSGVTSIWCLFIGCFSFGERFFMFNNLTPILWVFGKLKNLLSPKT